MSEENNMNMQLKYFFSILGLLIGAVAIVVLEEKLSTRVILIGLATLYIGYALDPSIFKKQEKNSCEHYQKKNKLANVLTLIGIIICVFGVGLNFIVN